jgi:hypothetical protein
MPGMEVVRWHRSFMRYPISWRGMLCAVWGAEFVSTVIWIPLAVERHGACLVPALPQIWKHEMWFSFVRSYCQNRKCKASRRSYVELIVLHLQEEIRLMLKRLKMLRWRTKPLVWMRTLHTSNSVTSGCSQYHCIMHDRCKLQTSGLGFWQ